MGLRLGPPLEPEQEHLLAALVEAARRVDREDREFFLSRIDAAMEPILGAGLGQPLEVIYDDVVQLVERGYLRITDGGLGGSLAFRVSSSGERQYESIKRRAGAPAQQVEEDARTHLEAEPFRSRYPGAYERWSEAVTMLWGADSQRQLSTIGHKCREAMQAFATGLVSRHRPQRVDEDPARTINRVQAVVTLHRSSLGDRRTRLLEAALEYWRATDGMVQRQEHAEQKRGEPVTWQDARSVVLSAVVAMAEIDRALPDSSGRVAS